MKVICKENWPSGEHHLPVPDLVVGQMYVVDPMYLHANGSSGLVGHPNHFPGCNNNTEVIAYKISGTVYDCYPKRFFEDPSTTRQVMIDEIIRD